MNGTARSYITSVKPPLSAYSYLGNSSSLRDAQNSTLPTLIQTSSSISVDTLSAAMVSVNTTALSSSLQSPRTRATFSMSIVQSTSATRQAMPRSNSASRSAQSGLSWSQVVGGSAPTVGLVTHRGTTTTAGKSGMLAEGQASLSASTTTGGSLINYTAGGDLLLAAPSDAALAESLTAALLAQQVSTISAVPPGMAVETIKTKTKCSHAFAMATTKSSGSTVTTVIPKICHDDAAYLLFPGVAIALLCTRAFSLFGFVLRWVCDPKTGAVLGVDDITGLPPDPAEGGGSGKGPKPDPHDDPDDDDPRSKSDEPTNSRDPSGRASSTNLPSTHRLSSTMTISDEATNSRDSSGRASSTNSPSTNSPSTSGLSSRMTTSASTATARRASSTRLPSSSRISSNMTASASTATANPYYVFAGVGDEVKVSERLGALDVKYKALQPAVGSTPMSGGDWVNVNLTDDEVASLSPNPDVLLLAPYLSLTESDTMTGNEVSTTASFSTLSSYSSTTVSTLSASSAFSELSISSGLPKVKAHRRSPSHQIRDTKLSASLESNDTEKVVLTKREVGGKILAQYGSDKMPCPRDLAVIAWAPGVPAVYDRPYLFLQSQGEGTWAILVSSGVESHHVVSEIMTASESLCED